MAIELFVNDTGTTLSAGCDDSQTTISVTSASAYPTTGNFRLRIDTELLLVTGVSGTTLTVTRGIEGTTPASHSNGATVKHVLTAEGLHGITHRTLPLFRQSVPSAGDFTWVNQSTSVLTHYGSFFTVSAPASASDSVRLLHTTPPSTPWTLDAIVAPDMVPTNYSTVGINVYDTSSTQILSLNASYNNGWIIDATRWNSPTSWNSNLASRSGWGTLNYLHLRINNNATNYTLYYSLNGIVFTQLYQAGVSAWGSPNKIGVHVNNSSSQVVGIGVLSFVCA